MLHVYYNSNDATILILLFILHVMRPHEPFSLTIVLTITTNINLLHSTITNNATTDPRYHAHSLVTASLEKLIPVLVSVLQKNPGNSKMLGTGGRLLRRLSLSTNSLHAACVNAGSVSVMVEAFQMDKVSLQKYITAADCHSACITTMYHYYQLPLLNFLH